MAKGTTPEDQQQRRRATDRGGDGKVLPMRTDGPHRQQAERRSDELERRRREAEQLLQPEQPAQCLVPASAAGAADAEEVEELHASIKHASAAQVVIAIAVVLVICYVGKLVLVTIATAVLIAFILEPLVRLLGKIKVPRALGSLISIVLLLAIFGGLTYFFYSRAVDFAHQLPKYSGKIRGVLQKYEHNSEELKKSTQQVIPQSQDSQQAVKVKDVSKDNQTLAGFVQNSFGTVTELLLTITFIPFLVFFMLTGQEHARKATVRLFDREHRPKAYETLGKISEMMRAFIFGNFMIGLFLAGASIIVFGFLHIQYFYFLGLISGFLSLIPYLGVFLAILPPLAAGAMELHFTGILIVLGTVLGLHLFAMNVLYPKLLGRRVDLNPLAVTLSLLIWGWIWGAMGLIFAVPVMAAIKIVCDNVEGLRPFAAWLGEAE
jgi:predicted PurR-regulated permease PerM